MCHFASGVVTRDGRILVGDRYSHGGIAEGYGLQPGEYREWELQHEEINRLEIRLEPGETDRAYWASAFAGFANRTELLASITEGRSRESVYEFTPGGVTLKTVATRLYVDNCAGVTTGATS